MYSSISTFCLITMMKTREDKIGEQFYCNGHFFFFNFRFFSVFYEGLLFSSVDCSGYFFRLYFDNGFHNCHYNFSINSNRSCSILGNFNRFFYFVHHKRFDKYYGREFDINYWLEIVSYYKDHAVSVDDDIFDGVGSGSFFLAVSFNNFGNFFGIKDSYIFYFLN